MGRVTVDLSGLKQLQKALEDADGETLQVGWFESAKYDADTPVAAIAAMQEFGTKSAPPRPFFRPAVAENESKWATLADSGGAAVIDGRATMSDVFNGLGLTVQADVKNAITGPHRALSPVTLALRKLKHDGVAINGTVVGAVAAAVARGETGPGQIGAPFSNDTPLQDSGIMLATITYNVGETPQ